MLTTDVDEFSAALSEVANLRDMWEHELEYREGRGWRQEQWLQPLDPHVTLMQEATAVSTLTDADGRPIHRPGGRLDVQPTIEVARKMLRQLERAMERLPPLGSVDPGIGSS